MSIEAILGFRANCKIDQCTNFLPHRDRNGRRISIFREMRTKTDGYQRSIPIPSTNITRKSRLSQFLKNFQQAVRNGDLRERRVQTGIGEVEVRVPKVRDHSGWVRVVRSIYTLPHGK